MNAPAKAASGPFGRGLWVVIAVALLERLALWLAYPPVIFDDTNSYRRLAGQLLGSAPFDGTRSPGYPAFLAWLGPDRNVYTVQLALGVATTLLFFYLGWLITGKAWAGTAAALIHTLNVGQLFFEPDLLAETLTTFLAVVTLCGGVYFLVKGFEQPGLQSAAQRIEPGLSNLRMPGDKWGRLSTIVLRSSMQEAVRQFGIALLTGISGGLTALVRPQFVFLPFFIAFVLVLEAARKSLPDTAQNLKHEGTQSIATLAPALRASASAGEETLKSSSLVSFVVKALRSVVKEKKLWGLVFAIILPAILLNALWINYIHTQFGVWSMSSDDGYHIIQHTGKFFEYVPDQYAAIRDTFLQYRAIQIANTGSSSNTIWAALPALQKVSGLGFYKLSHKLQEISWQLIRDHPLLYLGSVLEAWAAFWSAPFYWDAQGFRSAASFFSALVQVQRILLWGANITFIAGTFALVFQRIRKALPMPVSIWLMLGVVWVNSILQAVVEASENPRYSVSTQSLVVLVVAWWVWQIMQKRGQRNETV